MEIQISVHLGEEFFDKIASAVRRGMGGPAEEPVEVMIDDLRNKVKEIIADKGQGGKDMVVALLTEHGAKSLSQLPEDTYHSFLTALGDI